LRGVSERKMGGVANKEPHQDLKTTLQGRLAGDVGHKSHPCFHCILMHRPLEGEFQAEISAYTTHVNILSAPFIGKFCLPIHRLCEYFDD